MSLAEKRSVQPVASLQLPRPNALERGQINGSPSLFNYPLPPSAASDACLISSPRRQSFVPSPSHRRPSPGSAHDEPSDEAKTMFQQRCVEFYYQGNALSGKAVDTTLRDAPPLQRKSFNTIQANVRGQFHIDTANRKRLNLHALLRDIQPGSAVANHCRLSPASPVQAWRSKDARAFRYRQLCEFVKLYARRSAKL